MTATRIEPDWFSLKAGEIIQAALDAKKAIAGKLEALKSSVEFTQHHLEVGHIEPARASASRTVSYIREVEEDARKLDDVIARAEEINAEVRRLQGKTVLPFP